MFIYKIMILPNKKKFLSYKQLSHEKKTYFPKLSPERIHNLFKEVNTYYQKLSPSNCSKNMLAINSNIDAEIENAKNLGSISVIPTSRSQNNSLSPNKNRIVLSKLSLTPSKQINLEDKYIKYTLTDPEPVSELLIPKDKYRSGRLKKIEKIIDKCSGLKEKIQSIKRFNLTPLILTPKSIDSPKPEKNFDQQIVERCKKHFSNIKYTDDDTIKMAQALKRGKKIWKQHHLSFIKKVDKVVNSIANSKK